MTVERKVTIGALALQGAFAEHVRHLNIAIELDDYSAYSFTFIEVRTEEELVKCDGLIIPGGESTAISLIAERTNMLKPLQEFVKLGKPIWGTCAGLIFLAKQCINGKPDQQLLGALDIQVKRNAFGRQLDSFKTNLDFSHFIKGVDQFPTIFIRAPVITKISLELMSKSADLAIGETIIYSSNTYNNSYPVQVLEKLDNGLIVAVRQGNKLATSFHPELSNDSRIHKWFIDEFVLKSL